MLPLGPTPPHAVCKAYPTPDPMQSPPYSLLHARPIIPYAGFKPCPNPCYIQAFFAPCCILQGLPYPMLHARPFIPNAALKPSTPHAACKAHLNSCCAVQYWCCYSHKLICCMQVAQERSSSELQSVCMEVAADCLPNVVVCFC